MGRGWKSLEVHARKSLDCEQKIVSRNMDIKSDSGMDSEKRRAGRKASLFVENT